MQLAATLNKANASKKYSFSRWLLHLSVK